MLTRRDAKMIAKELVVMSPNNDIDPNEVYRQQSSYILQRELYIILEKRYHAVRGESVCIIRGQHSNVS